jgi:ssDNA-specific exonuclease RecJ
MNFIGNPEKLNIQGLSELQKKNTDSFNHLKSPFKDFSHINSFFDAKQTYFLTGIGSSESHARYLEALMKNYT